MNGIRADLEAQFPHAPDLYERETADNGFSKGWGMHFRPAPERIVDMHAHVEFIDDANAISAVGRHAALVQRAGVTRTVACTPVMTRPGEEGRPQGFSVRRLSGFDALRPYIGAARACGGLSLMLFLHYENPDAALLRRCAAEGICGVKLHNAPAIVDGADPALWRSAAWAEVFGEIGRLGVPVLWHVTQRLTGSPYTGGGRNTYWKEGWEKGVRYTNEDLLGIYLGIIERYPDIPFVSAHQLHIGWERLDALFGKYPNLYSDTSIGCQVNEDDALYEGDVEAIRPFFLRHADRMLFGTDCFISDAAANDPVFTDEGKAAIVKNHIRFIRQLRLPDGALRKIMHGNAERLFRLPR